VFCSRGIFSGSENGTGLETKTQEKFGQTELFRVKARAENKLREVILQISIQKESDYIEPSLHAPSTLLRTVSLSNGRRTNYLAYRLGDSSGITDASDRAIVSKRG
jgi:hypothetical protein